ncbi:hypothetical protein GY45DRAFT_363257 [Cubamyces sp. BRFM 1775]|nr:hypothetical protein GY45DRAFT_363257 [Cubamyces sp. BRFM 1775]
MTFVELSDVSEWLDTCLPGGDLPVNIRRSVVPFEVALDRQDVGMYPGLCKGFNNLLTVCGMDKIFVMKITGAHKDTVAQGAKDDGDENKDRPDLVMYPDTDEARESFVLTDDPASSLTARMIWAHSEFMIEARTRKSQRSNSRVCSRDVLASTQMFRVYHLCASSQSAPHPS